MGNLRIYSVHRFFSGFYFLSLYLCISYVRLILVSVHLQRHVIAAQHIMHSIVLPTGLAVCL